MPRTEGPPSLAEFAASLKQKPPCRVCELPELEEIHAARSQGVAFKVIAAWLETLGYEPGFISHHRVEKHFGEKHHV